MNYLISVIIPVYGVESYLNRCVDSVLNQTYDNIEIILVDDGSLDNSPDICDDYAQKDSRVKVIHQKNKGVSAARNAGIELALGDYITFVDGDDELLDSAIEIMLNDILQYNADISYAVKCHVGSDGSVANQYEDNEYHYYEGTESLVLSLEGERQTNSACAKLFKRDFIKDIRFVEGRNINEDGFFLFECYTKLPKVVQHNICVYKYHIISGSSSRKCFSEKFFDMIYFCDRKKEIINEKFPGLSGRLINMEVSTHLFFLENLCRTKDSKYRNHIKNSIFLVKKNYKKFKCINSHERKMAWIVAHNFYPIYKFLIRLKFRYKD